MKKLALITACLTYSWCSFAQSDLLITMEGDTIPAKISRSSDWGITYTRLDASDITFTDSKSKFAEIQFGNEALEDYKAPRHWMKNEGFMFTAGISEVFRPQSVDVYSFVNFSGETMFTRSLGLQIVAGWGTNLTSIDKIEEVMDAFAFQFSTNAIYRYSLPGSKWSYSLAPGLNFRQYNYTDSGISDVSTFGFGLGIGTQFISSSGFVFGYDLPINYWQNNTFGVGLNIGLGYRF
ncbi:MAG: hypothetical protein HWE14_08420 [Flavobacteriia bacterium]|nr:hypothetical protein [Flavobacteriia bacterium]